MNHPELILFDLGGVLFEYRNFFNTAAKELKIERNVILHTLGEYALEANLGKITLHEIYLKCIEENGFDIDKNYDITLSYVRDLERIVPSYNFLIRLSKKYNIGLLSNIFKGFVPLIIEREIIPNIDYKYKFLSCDIGLKKPDNEIYEYVNTKTGLNPNKIFFVDDYEENTEAARKHGWQVNTFLRETPEQSIEVLTKQLFCERNTPDIRSGI